MEEKMKRMNRKYEENEEERKHRGTYRFFSSFSECRRA